MPVLALAGSVLQAQPMPEVEPNVEAASAERRRRPVSAQLTLSAATPEVDVRGAGDVKKPKRQRYKCVKSEADLLRSRGEAGGGVAFRLIPREERFYDDFVALAEQIRHGAALLEEMLAPEQPIWDKADEIKEVEHKCDFLTHEIIQRLHRTFVTPLDREDIFALARSLDDVMDAIDATRRDRPALSDRGGAARRARADADHHATRPTSSSRR